MAKVTHETVLIKSRYIMGNYTRSKKIGVLREKIPTNVQTRKGNDKKSDRRREIYENIELRKHHYLLMTIENFNLLFESKILIAYENCITSDIVVIST